MRNNIMKSYINRFLIGGALVATMGLTACVGDLNQFPQDERVTTASDFKANPKEYLSGTLAKCYSGIAISGQTGAGSSDISGLDNGRSCWSRAIFMLNEFTTDECNWIWKDSGVFDLCTMTWSTNNENVFGTYSRLLTHIAICNDFLRLTSPESLDFYGIEVGGTGDKAISQADIDQFRLEARALRGLSYFYMIDLFCNSVKCWDDTPAGEAPAPTKRADLFKLVTDDLEDVLKAFPDTKPVYGRIGKDAVEALLAKYYLNSEVWTGQKAFDKCLQHCQSVINRHQGGGFQGSGLTYCYHYNFCKNNHIFAPGGSMDAQNEILWNIPYEFRMTESYGGSSFLILAAISDQNKSAMSWYGINGQWTCMHARTQFSEKFSFSNGQTNDKRAYLWLTEGDDFNISNRDFSTYKDGYVPVKFTNVDCDPSQTDYTEANYWADPETGLNRFGKHNLKDDQNYGIPSDATFADTDLPVIRLSEIYLTAAEAIVRGGGGSNADALTYVNYVRQRAGVPAWSLSELTLQHLLDERARELYWENNRRTDLVRFGQYATGYTWNWKNNVPLGADVDSHMNVFPIPTQVITSYSIEYPQNQGY
ncbi:MAG: RagB/SusD family nutrient uptake outer membrane protein [Muribaculaceae bacterium]|nr:RagB/SusD family nutrient uptake outer membrane protein [Muribaculaceae bacterium]